MSLVSLTFKGESKKERQEIEIMGQELDYPDDGKETVVKVLKVSEIIGSPLYIVGKVESGTVAGNMRTVVNNKKAVITELECKTGTNYAVEGMTVGFCLAGVRKFDIAKDSCLKFEK